LDLDLDLDFLEDTNVMASSTTIAFVSKSRFTDMLLAALGASILFGD
jgi:hypothetical protein